MDEVTGADGGMPRASQARALAAPSGERRDPIRNVVVVKFSLRVPEWRRRSFVDEGNRKEWFKYRAELYRQTLGASMRCQSERVEGLYMLMDEEDRALYGAHLDDGTMIPVFARRGHHEQVAEDILRRGWRRNLAMSRIDSDDIVGKDYFREINGQIGAAREAGEGPELIVACLGYRSNFKVIQRTYYEASPFITRFSKDYAGGSVYTMEHQTLGATPHVKNHTAEWMQVIHGTNVANGFMKPGAAFPTPADMEGGRAQTSGTSLGPADGKWFAAWAGFAMPDPAMFEAAPVDTWRKKVRVFWRRARGKV